MATYSKTFSKISAYTLYLDVNEKSVDIANNRSVISWKLRVVSTKALQYGSWDTNVPYSVSINGVSVASGNKSYDFRNYQTLTIASGQRTITHDDDGTKSVACSGSYGSNSASIGKATASGTFTLTPIPRYCSVTVTPASGVVMGDTISLLVEQPITTASHYLYYWDMENESWEEIGHDNQDHTYSFTVPDYTAYYPNDDVGDIQLRCLTYLTNDYSGTPLEDITTFAAQVPASDVPTVSCTIKENNSNIPSNFPYIVGYSLLRVIVNFAGVQGSRIIKVSVSANGETQQYFPNISDTSYTFNLITPLASTSNAVVITVSDSRGRVTTLTPTVDASPYSPPEITDLDLTRMDSASSGSSDPLGTFVAVQCSWQWSSLMKNSSECNSATARVKIDGSDTTPPTIVSLTPNSQPNLTEICRLAGLSNSQQYTITVIVTDAISSTERSGVVTKSQMPMSLFDDGSDVGATFGRMATQPGLNSWLNIGLISGNKINLYDSNSQLLAQIDTDDLFGTNKDWVVAWTNPDGDSTGFATKTVTLTGYAESDYSYYEVIFNGLYNDLVYVSTGKLPVGKPASLFYLAVSSSNYRIRAREVTASTDSSGNIKLTFAQGYQWTGGSTTGSSNNICIPVQILLYT